MPIYEYRCGKCRKVFEVLQKFSDPPLKRHKDCGGTVERLVSQSSFQLKGGGWYASGYAKEAPKPEKSSDAKAESAANGASDSKAESKADSKGGSKAETKTESKAESKSETKSDSKAAAKEKPSKSKSKE